MAVSQWLAGRVAAAPSAMAADAGWSWVVYVSLIIFAAAFSASLLPLFFLRVRFFMHVTAFGAGLCIGASLSLMIPEGFHLLIEAHEKYGMNPGLGGFFLTLGTILFFVVEALQENTNACNAHGSHDFVGVEEGIPSSDEPLVGRGRSISSGGGTHASAVDGGDDKKRHRRSSPQARGLLTLAMMVGHAVTDGLVIGSAAATGQQELSLVVAFAMIAHKVPASFSLSTFLFSIKWPTAAVLKSMLVFSLSSPLAAVGFYAIKFLVSESDFEKMISWVMLFSAGSILYVGFFHMLPEALEVNQGKAARKQVVCTVAAGSFFASMFAFVPHDH
mmetsp:Transcript_9443/g.28714  ORF Transcript_9443/g.28714 Transcript_9443/m.28714 type:complete len:331 (-) Transcript_9443:146-1138(-)